MTQPTWAQAILEEVCREKKRSLPTTKWIQRDRVGSSGVYYPYKKRMVLCLGSDEEQHLQVFLHELAHHLACRNRKGAGHNKKFWILHKELLLKYNCLTEKWKERAYRYKKKAQLYL